ncbi:hypothetical protein ARSEF4850_003742 [Beauveria asiatica]
MRVSAQMTSFDVDTGDTGTQGQHTSRRMGPTRKDTLVVCYDGDSARVAASVMRAKGYAANSLRGGLVGLVTMLSTPQTCAKAGPEQQTSWLQLCEAQRAPAAAVEAPAAKSSSELLELQQAAVTVKYWSIE